MYKPEKSVEIRFYFVATARGSNCNQSVAVFFCNTFTNNAVVPQLHICNFIFRLSANILSLIIHKSTLDVSLNTYLENYKR